MERIVVYQSGTGFTAKYADWIAKELCCEVTDFKKIKKNELIKYDQVIYGGWIMGNMVYGYNKISALNLKNVVVFGVGMSVPCDELFTKIAEQNKIEKDRLFYFEGGYNPQKVGLIKKMMMNMIKKSVEKKPEKTPEDVHLLETFKGADNTKKEYIQPLIEFVKG